MPLVSSQTRGGGSLRLSFVSVEIALCVGPRKAVQSCVAASLASGFAFETTRVCALASVVASAFTVKVCNIARRDMSDMAASYICVNTGFVGGSDGLSDLRPKPGRRDGGVRRWLRLTNATAPRGRV